MLLNDARLFRLDDHALGRPSAGQAQAWFSIAAGASA